MENRDYYHSNLSFEEVIREFIIFLIMNNAWQEFLKNLYYRIPIDHFNRYFQEFKNGYQIPENLIRCAFPWQFSTFDKHKIEYLDNEWKEHLTKKQGNLNG